MGRTRLYATAADRQKAYRARQAAATCVEDVLDTPSSQGTGQNGPTPPQRGRRPPSRPARLQALENAVRELQLEYEEWLDTTPESLTDGATAERLREAIEQLETAADTIAEIQAPRGFGRD